MVTPKGESQPYTLFVGGEFPVLEEKEGNDGFRQAQAIQVPQIINGSIHGDRNVDCFVIAGQAGQNANLVLGLDETAIAGGLGYLPRSFSIASKRFRNAFCTVFVETGRMSSPSAEIPRGLPKNWIASASEKPASIVASK